MAYDFVKTKTQMMVESITDSIPSNPTMVYEADYQNRMKLAIEIYRLELQTLEMENKSNPYPII